MKFTFYGQSCFLIEFGDKLLLTDPFIHPNLKAKDFNIEDLQPDYILLSHGHGDHVEDLKEILSHSKATLISTFELVTYYQDVAENGHGMNTGGKFSFDLGMVKLVSAVHSSVLPDGTYGSNPVGFVVWNDNNCFYFAGDTALTLDMKLIPMTCPPLDIAILPIGDNFTMGYEDAAIAAEFINCDQIIGCHYDTFPPIEIDHNSAVAEFKKKEKTLHLLEPNKSLKI